MHSSFTLGAIATLLTAALAAPQGKPFVKRQDNTYSISAFCFSDRPGLDHASVDQSNQALQGWAGSGNTISTKDHNVSYGTAINNAIVYACTDDHYGSNTFSSQDVIDAMAAMDSQCEAYEASYAIWVDSESGVNSGKIIGKDFANVPVCQG